MCISPFALVFASPCLDRTVYTSFLVGLRAAVAEDSSAPLEGVLLTRTGHHGHFIQLSPSSVGHVLLCWCRRVVTFPSSRLFSSLLPSFPPSRVPLCGMTCIHTPLAAQLGQFPLHVSIHVFEVAGSSHEHLLARPSPPQTELVKL